MESLVALGDLPHCVGYAYRHGEADSLVSRVIDVLDERREQKNTTPRYLLVIDELLDIKQHCTPKMLDTWLPRIATLGRELGIHLLIGSQEMLSKEVGAQLKNHMYFRLAGIANDSLHSVAITGRAQVFAHHLPGRGQMFLVQSGKPHIRVQVPMVKDARAYAKRVQDRWGKDFETWNLDIPTFVDGESDAMTRVRSVFAEAWDDDRKKLRNGALTDICKAYFGEEAELAGGKQRKTKKLVEKLKEEIYA
jgi:DNA segregation ATPase FtsK/SpoIIIE-like protein